MCTDAQLVMVFYYCLYFQHRKSTIWIFINHNKTMNIKPHQKQFLSLAKRVHHFNYYPIRKIFHIWTKCYNDHSMFWGLHKVFQVYKEQTKILFVFDNFFQKKQNKWNFCLSIIPQSSNTLFSLRTFGQRFGIRCRKSFYGDDIREQWLWIIHS